MWLGRALGYDFGGFVRSYPLRADTRSGYVTHLTSQTLATLLLTQRLPRPVVVTVHDILPYLLQNDPELRVYRHRIDRVVDSCAMRGLRRADRLITDSAYTKQTLVQTLHLSPERIDVVHLGVDSERFKPRPVPDVFRARFDLRPDRRHVLFVGSEDPRKDLATLIKALPMVRRSVPDAVLLKVGAPAFAEQRVRHRALCHDLGITDAVRWIDEVSEEDLPLFYNAADVFVFPSLYEGFGFPVLEALACGTPVVAVNASSVPELVADRGVLVGPRDPDAMAGAVVGMLLGPRPDPDASIRWARGFTWARTISATIMAYRAAQNSALAKTTDDVAELH
jgi:glycosyltransferase involved in cell wall biosynthesis